MIFANSYNDLLYASITIFNNFIELSIDSYALSITF